MLDHRLEARPIRTPWLTVLLAICAGMLAAFQVGKVHIALSSVRQSFSLGLISASWALRRSIRRSHPCLGRRMFS